MDNLAPGGTATLRGSNLSLVTSLTVDGQAVTLTGISEAERTFAVPASFGRNCETDGRPIPVVANGSITIRAPLHLTDTVAMAVGEVRVVSPAAGECLRFGANDQDYALVALNPSLATSDQLLQIASVRTWTRSDQAPSAARIPAQPLFDRIPGDAHVGAMSAGSVAVTGADPFREDPVPFDPGYRTAQVGDTVRFIARGNYNVCNAPKTDLTTFPVEIAAVEGNTVIGIDLRLANAAEHRANRTWLAVAARIADPLVEPAMHAVFGSSYAPLRGGGGRHFAVVTELESGIGGASVLDIAGNAQAECPNSSEMVATALSAARLTNSQGYARDLAKVIVHEYAHNADYITARRAGYSFGANRFLVEPWAVAAEDAAVRIASGQNLGATMSELGQDDPIEVFGPFSFWGNFPNTSPWTSPGVYNNGAALLMYARERVGDTDLTRSAPALFQRMLGRNDRDVATALGALAAEVGTTPDALLRDYALAHATDNLIAADAAAFPRFRTWDGILPGFTTNHLPRSTNVARTLAAAPGNYASAYLMAEDGAGISLEFTSPAAPESAIRLVRLR